MLYSDSKTANVWPLIGLRRDCYDIAGNVFRRFTGLKLNKLPNDEYREPVNNETPTKPKEHHDIRPLFE